VEAASSHEFENHHGQLAGRADTDQQHDPRVAQLFQQAHLNMYRTGYQHF